MSSADAAERPFTWFYSMYQDGEQYSPANSREDAIARGRKEAIEDGHKSFWICEANRMRLHDDIFDADSVCEWFEEENELAWGEDGPDRNISDAAKVELAQVLTTAFATWRAKHKPWTAYMLDDFRNVEKLLVGERPAEADGNG